MTRAPDFCCPLMTLGAIRAEADPRKGCPQVSARMAWRQDFSDEIFESSKSKKQCGEQYLRRVFRRGCWRGAWEVPFSRILLRLGGFSGGPCGRSSGR